MEKTQFKQLEKTIRSVLSESMHSAMMLLERSRDSINKSLSESVANDIYQKIESNEKKIHEKIDGITTLLESHIKATSEYRASDYEWKYKLIEWKKQVSPSISAVDNTKNFFTLLRDFSKEYAQPIGTLVILAYGLVVFISKSK